MSQDTASAAAASPDNARAADRVVPAGSAGDPWLPDARALDVPDDWPPDPLDEEWEDWLETQSPRPPEALPAGLLPRDCGDGPGFAAGGVADRLAPDVTLAGFARDAWTDGLDRLSDDELIGVLRAWRRLSSWTAAGELAAVAELNDRRIAQVAAGADPHLSEHVSDELAVSLTLTARSADALLDFACGLARLPLTRAALAAGEIDRVKALVITDEVSCLDDAHAAAVESAVIGRAPGQTSGRLRAATKRAVVAVDPAAVRKRRDRAQQEARVEVWDEHSGTAALAGRDLPPADVLAADKRIDALAKHLKSAGLDGTLDQLRARVYTALLLGQPVGSLEPAGSEIPGSEIPGRAVPGSEGPGNEAQRSETQSSRPGSGDCRGVESSAASPGSMAGLGGPVLTGSVNVTLPLTTWLGATEEPGDVGGFGPIPADDARALVNLITNQPGARWCLTLTDRDGRAIGHGCARPGPERRRSSWDGTGPERRRSGRGEAGPERRRSGRGEAGPERRRSGRGEAGPDDDWALTVTVRPLAVDGCAHQRETAGYRPAPSLRHVIDVRHRTCSFPGCRRPAVQCDQDHTIPYDQGGRTCECNLACLCRRHHRAKQAQGWQLGQPEPGVLVWTLPHGRSYRVEPTGYPAADP